MKARAAHSKRSIAQEHTGTRHRYVGIYIYSLGLSAIPGWALTDPNSNLSVQSPGWGAAQAPWDGGGQGDLKETTNPNNLSKTNVNK